MHWHMQNYTTIRNKDVPDPTEEKMCAVDDLADNELRFRDVDLLNNSVQNMINVFERWCCRRTMRI